MKKLSLICLSALLALSMSACKKEAPKMESEAPEVLSSSQVGSVETPTEKSSAPAESPSTPAQSMRIASLKGPTGLGMLPMLEEAKPDYEFTILGSPDEIAPLFLGDKADLISVPANLAANLYTKTKGETQVLCINTLGMLSVLERGDSIKTIGDLKGRTIYSSGKGASPEIMLNFLLEKNGLDSSKDLEIVYKAQHEECLAALLSDPEGVAVLPEPFASAATLKDSTLRYALSFNDEWSRVDSASLPVTGVIIAKKSYLASHKEEVKAFLADYAASALFMNKADDEACALAEKYKICPAPVAKAAIPRCAIKIVEGSDMKNLLDPYIKVLFDSLPASIGGELPKDDFYYIP
ncbi:MAG: ABC transporter substrate-binding protein [Oscillospiraceae bacterium]